MKLGHRDRPKHLRDICHDAETSFVRIAGWIWFLILHIYGGTCKNYRSIPCVRRLAWMCSRYSSLPAMRYLDWKHKIYPQPPSPCCDTRRCPFRYGLAGNPKLYIYILPPVGSSPTNTTTLDFLPAIYYALVSLISYGSLLKLTSNLLLGTHVSTVSILRSAPQAVGAFRRIVMCKLCASILL